MMNERMYYSRDAEMRAQRERLLLVGFATLIGLSLGAILALLSAQRTGRETREMVSGQVERVVNDAEKSVNKLQKEIDGRISAARN
ncbi:MAG: YtxH domain-containing protein [Anaerolineae bacterium]|nr:YtxH domain-containing protein [Anaerolineae bacterium]